MDVAAEDSQKPRRDEMQILLSWVLYLKPLTSPSIGYDVIFYGFMELGFDG
jgi:hypothetical protein